MQIIALDCLSGLLADVRANYSLSSILGGEPIINFSFGQSICPACFGELAIKNVKPRKVYTTNYGTLKIKEHKKRCNSCKQLYGSERLPLIVKKGSNYSIYSDIRYQTKALEKQVGGSKTARELFYAVKDCKGNSPELLQGILYGYLQELKSREYNGDGYGFPFDRTKLVYYNDLKRIHTEMETIENHQVFEHDLLVKCRFYKIKEVLSIVLADKELACIVKNLELHIEYFDRLRDIMRIAIPGDKKGLNDPGKITNEKELYDVETELKKYLENLKKEKHKLPKVRSVIKQLEKYWDKIFAGGIETIVQGEPKTIIPQRTNNTSEQFYRRLKQFLRRLHGNSKVNKDLLYLPEEIALIENLSNHQYINNLMKSESQLAIEFAKLDIQGRKLPYEKQELELVIPHKMKKTLKNFRPLEHLIKLKSQ